MKKIPLVHGTFALVDDRDCGRLSKYRWYKTKNLRVFCILKKTQRMLMHKMILNIPFGRKVIVVFKDGNTLDHRRKNLEVLSNSQNQTMRPKVLQNVTSKYKGVSWAKGRSKWIASICYMAHPQYIGSFMDEEAAARAYNEEAKRLFGKYAKLNDIKAKNGLTSRSNQREAMIHAPYNYERTKYLCLTLTAKDWSGMSFQRKMRVAIRFLAAGKKVSYEKLVIRFILRIRGCIIFNQTKKNVKGYRSANRGIQWDMIQESDLNLFSKVEKMMKRYVEQEGYKKAAAFLKQGS